VYGEENNGASMCSNMMMKNVDDDDNFACLMESAVDPRFQFLVSISAFDDE